MRKNLILALISLTSVSCGSSDDPFFPGTWDGTLPLAGNDCPFSAPADQNQLFPVLISESANNQLAVQGADGSSGTGVEDENNQSFLVSGTSFGTITTDTGTLTACTINKYFGFFSAQSTTAQSELRITFTDCTNSSGSQTSCSVLYAGYTNKR